MANKRVSNHKHYEVDEFGGRWVYVMSRYVCGRQLASGVYLSQYDIMNRRLMCAQHLRDSRRYLNKLVAEYKGKLS